MKAISIRQPFAWLIAQGSKNIENRTWTTPYRGSVLIHAGRHVDPGLLAQFNLAVKEQNPGTPAPLVHIGGIIGIVDLVDIVTTSDNEWFNGPYGWVLANARPLEFHPCAGKLGIFDVDYPHQIDSTPQESWLYELIK